MQLTDQQAEAARGLGCRFIPATEAQVRQFSMQRRVFTISGAPFLAARQDGFYETAGTLLALIAGAPPPLEAPATPEPEAQAAEEPELASEAPKVTEAEATPEAMPEPVAAVPPPIVPVDTLATTGGAPLMAATVTIVKGYARRGTLDTERLTTLVATVHDTLRRLR